MNGMPVSPSRLVTASGLSTSKLPPKPNWTWGQVMPASWRAARTASAAMSMADLSPKRPKGCSPTPMIATSFTSATSLAVHRREREGQHLGAVVVGAERHDLELDLHADAEPFGVVLGEP